MNNKGETNLIVVLVIIALLGFVAYQMGYIDLPSSGQDNGGSSNEPSDATTKNCPTTGITTYTLNVQDELASSPTNVNAEYYIFNGNKLIKEGTTGTDGSVDVDVTCGKDYKVLLLNTTAGNSIGLYAKTLDLQARTSADTVNTELVQPGWGQILGIENPADPSRIANVSLVAGQVKNFDLKFVANVTEKGFNKPIIMCEANVSAIASVKINSFSDGTSVNEVTTLPKRITAKAGNAYYAYEYPKMLTPAMGVITASGSITALASATPATDDYMNCTLVDQATWKTSGYKTASSIEAGFKSGPENTETLVDVGAPDSSQSAMIYSNANGY